MAKVGKSSDPPPLLDLIFHLPEGASQDVTLVRVDDLVVAVVRLVIQHGVNRVQLLVSQLQLPSPSPFLI